MLQATSMQCLRRTTSTTLMYQKTGILLQLINLFKKQL